RCPSRAQTTTAAPTRSTVRSIAAPGSCCAARTCAPRRSPSGGHRAAAGSAGRGARAAGGAALTPPLVLAAVEGLPLALDPGRARALAVRGLPPQSDLPLDADQDLRRLRRPAALG